jgi:putative drug exporter of the RND superfamily
MGLTERLARSCSLHPWRTLAVWGAVVVLALGAVATLLNGLTTDATVTNNPESTRAAALINRHFPFDKNKVVTDVLVIRSDTYTVDDPQFAQFAALLLGTMRATHKLQAAHVWVKEHDPSLISADRHATRIPLFVGSDDDADALVKVVHDANETAGFDVGITGDHTANNDFNTLSAHDLKAGELEFGLPAALIILVLVFGSLVGGIVPLVMAILSIAVGLGLVALLSQAFSLSIFIVNMLTGMGLALGVDYSLFVVSRYREERAAGRAKPDAIAMTGATASRAVLFSGTAFVVALFGMLLVPTTIMRSLAAGAIVVGVVSVFAALTLLPALLGLLGDRVNALRIPFVSGGGAAESRFWSRIVRAVLRRPVISLALAAGAMIVLALPVLGLHIGASGVSTLPDRMPSKQGYVLLQRYFPGDEVSPVRIVVRSLEASGVAGALERTATLLAIDPRFGRGQLQRSPDGALAVLSVPVRGDPKGKQAVGAVRDLRSRILPRAFADVGEQPLVGGQTAENVDYFDAASRPAPYVLAFVLGLTLVLLTVVFRSVVVAATAIVLNLLSVGAAYGLLVLVFLHGWGTHFLGFEKVYAIDAWVPLFLFSVLFGLSMDYQVFLLSRIRERFDQTGDTTGAVEYGVASTARIITGAALIIVAVFTGFARGDLVMFQQMGFGVAVALLLDATVIRSVVLPSAMKLLGRWNWYLPRWLEWLPRVNVEGPAAERAQPASAG